MWLLGERIFFDVLYKKKVLLILNPDVISGGSKNELLYFLFLK
jgi:hypothetical protein